MKTKSMRGLSLTRVGDDPKAAQDSHQVLDCPLAPTRVVSGGDHVCHIIRHLLCY